MFITIPCDSCTNVHYYGRGNYLLDCGFNRAIGMKAAHISDTEERMAIIANASNAEQLRRKQILDEAIAKFYTSPEFTTVPK